MDESRECSGVSWESTQTKRQSHSCGIKPGAPSSEHLKVDYIRLGISSWRAYHALHIICDGSRQLQCVLHALVIFLHIIIRAEYFTEHCCYILHV